MVITNDLIVIAAAICNSFMDSTETIIAYNKTIFGKYHWNWNPKIWCKQVAGDHHVFIPFTKYPIDSWHIVKSIFIVLVLWNRPEQTNWYVDITRYGIEWIITFKIFFEWVWISKRWKKATAKND